MTTVAESVPYGGISVDPTNGDIYVAEYSTHKIRRVASGWSVYVLWDLFTNYYQEQSIVAGTGKVGVVDGNSSVASFCHPFDVKSDLRDGSLFVADSGNNRIRKISKQGIFHFISKLILEGTSPFFYVPLKTSPGTQDIWTQDAWDIRCPHFFHQSQPKMGTSQVKMRTFPVWKPVPGDILCHVPGDNLCPMSQGTTFEEMPYVHVPGTSYVAKGRFVSHHVPMERPLSHCTSHIPLGWDVPLDISYR